MVIGGGHLWARHRLNINFFWLWLGLVLAVIMRKPLLLLPQSFGPLPGKLQQRMLYQVLRHSPFIAAREYRSLKFLHQIGVKQRVLVLPDLAFTTAEALPSSVATILSGITQQRANGRLVVGLTVMDWGRQTPNFYHQQRYETAVVALIRHLQINYNAYVVLFSQCCGPTPAEDDRRIARRIAQAVGQSNNLFLVETIVPPEVLKAAYRQMDIVVATRMHSAIFALSVGVPTLVISYLYKAIGMMEMLGLESHVLDINTITADYLCTGFDQLWAKRAAIRYHLSQRLPAIHTTLTQLPRLIRESVIIP
jgi:colanic acid/amylovoran biosynthesis protein